MVRNYYRFLVVIGSIVLSGCIATEGQFNTINAAMQGSPEYKKDFVAKCIAGLKAKPLGYRQEWAKIIRTSVDELPAVYCKRWTDAQVSGRMTYTDYRNGTSQTGDKSRLIAILQGR